MTKQLQLRHCDALWFTGYPREGFFLPHSEHVDGISLHRDCPPQRLVSPAVGAYAWANDAECTHSRRVVPPGLVGCVRRELPLKAAHFANMAQDHAFDHVCRVSNPVQRMVCAVLAPEPSRRVIWRFDHPVGAGRGEYSFRKGARDRPITTMPRQMWQ